MNSTGKCHSQTPFFLSSSPRNFTLQERISFLALGAIAVATGALLVIASIDPSLVFSINTVCGQIGIGLLGYSLAAVGVASVLTALPSSSTLKSISDFEKLLISKERNSSQQPIFRLMIKICKNAHFIQSPTFHLVILLYLVKGAHMLDLSKEELVERLDVTFFSREGRNKWSEIEKEGSLFERIFDQKSELAQEENTNFLNAIEGLKVIRQFEVRENAIESEVDNLPDMNWKTFLYLKLLDSFFQQSSVKKQLIFEDQESA